MRRHALFLALCAAGLAAAGSTDVAASGSGPRAGHQFRGSVEVQYRTNDNISIASASSRSFDFADADDFGIEDDEDFGDIDGDDDDFDDLADLDPSEDELEEDDAIDEDGDGIDDLIDPNADILVDSESRFTTKLAFGHRYTFADRRTSWNTGLRFASDTHNQRDDLDKFNWALTTGLTIAPRGSRHSFKPSLSYVALDRNSQKFSTTFIASLAYGYKISKQLTLDATYNYQDKDITRPTSPDARVDTFSVGVDFEATDNDIFRLEFSPKIEDSTEFTRNTDAWGWEVAYSRRLPWDMTAGVGYRFNAVEYTNLVPRREDDSRAWGVQLARKFGSSLMVELGYESSQRESNIPNKDAENDSLYVGGTWKF